MFLHGIVLHADGLVSRSAGYDVDTAHPGMVLSTCELPPPVPPRPQHRKVSNRVLMGQVLPTGILRREVPFHKKYTKEEE